MRYVTEPKRPLLFIDLLCHGKLTAGQQDYSYIKFQISREKPLGLSIGFYFFGGMGLWWNGEVEWNGVYCLYFYTDYVGEKNPQ